MDSFYGGPRGQDFSIKQIFNTRIDMDADLAKSWTSPISVGSFVVISYGLPSDANYEVYKGQDLNQYGKSYNSTLWLKCYNESVEGRSAAGLFYQLIASMTGNTPRIALNPTEILDVNENPDVEWDNSDIDKLVLTFQLPKNQFLGGSNIEVLNCNEQPTAHLNFALDTSTTVVTGRVYYKKEDNSDSYSLITFTEDEPYEASKYYYLPDINNPIIDFALPQSQVIETALIELLDVGQNPHVSLETSGEYSINRPAIKFYLPVSQSLQEGLTEILNANEDPYFEINYDDINNPIINFYLPQSQVMGNPETTVVGPTIEPSVQIDSTNINAPILKFSLPEAVKFYYGELLGQRDEATYEETNEAFTDYNIGDYYINAPTGFIYKVISKSDATCTFEYIACIQSPLPTVEVTEINPYTNGESGYEPTIPTIERTIDEATNSWKLTFGLPSAVKFTVSFAFVGVAEEGSVSSEIASPDTVNLDFAIPRGSRLFSGLEVNDTSLSAIVEGAESGDVYLNTNTGDIYELGSAGTWSKNAGNLKGPVGEALNIVKSYTINETETLKDSLQNGVNYIEANYTEAITAEDIFSITWVEYETNQETSYWYYKAADGAWGRVQLTGGITNLIDNVYNDESEGEVANKTYSVHYINSLIGGDMSGKDKTKVTYSASEIEELLSWGSFSDLIP